MANDYYNILGVSKDASDDDIKKAYRKLVHKHHPDKGGSEAEFKKVSEAYQVLSNLEKRKQYDMFGNSSGNFGGFNANAGDFNFSNQTFNVDLEDLFQGSGFESIFETFFGGRAGTRVRRRVETLNITLEEAFSGLERGVDFGEGKKFKISIPRGVDSGNRIKVDSSGGEDFYVEINVLPHSLIRRHGVDIVLDCSVRVSESLLGCSKKIRLIDEDISVKIPNGIKSGETLRIGGKGMYNVNGVRGDAYLRVAIETPKKLSRRVKKLLEELQGEGL